MVPTTPEPDTPEPVEGRELTEAERRPVTRETAADYKARERPDDERSTEERQAILAKKVAELVAAGHEIEYESPFDAVLVRKRRFGGKQRVLVDVDESGVLSVKDE